MAPSDGLDASASSAGQVKLNPNTSFLINVLAAAKPTVCALGSLLT
jgi:hypothetical protein